jgi:hypothetical protein
MTIGNFSIPSSVKDALFSNGFGEKVVGLARKVEGVPEEFPHYTHMGETRYKYFPSSTWTSGFFPGSLWALYERVMRHNCNVADGVSQQELLDLAKVWQEGMTKEQFNTNTHDIGFMIMPSFGRDYQLHQTETAKGVIIQAAESLMTRYSPITRCIRSWDAQKQVHREWTDPEKDFLVIIDNMMNLDLLYYASQVTGNYKYARVASTHAETTLVNHFRPDNSSYHMVVYDSITGTVKGKYTHQGYSDESTWSRGQAWALYGYASVYQYTKDKRFLDAAKRFTDYFLSRLPEDKTVYWDFDAPLPTYWDVSAAMIAVSGMLLIDSLDTSSRYTPDALRILNKVVTEAKAGAEWDTILNHSTVQNFEYALPKTKVADVGLVYADYYFIEISNRLLEMGYVI